MEKLDDSLINGLFDTLSLASPESYIFICDLEQDFSRWSKAAVDFFGMSSEYIYKAGDEWEKHVHPDDLVQYQSVHHAVFSGMRDSYTMEYRAKAADGNYVVVTCSGKIIRDNEQRPLLFTGFIRNHGVQDNYDTVTNLRNLYSFYNELRAYRMNKKTVNVLMVGITKFSQFNEIYGYTFGNSSLRRFGEMIQKEVEKRGKCFRMDGTKFAVISETIDMEEMKKLYKTIQVRALKEITLEGNQISLYICGSAMRIDDFDVTAHTAYSCLRYAYYESKYAKQGDLVVYTNALNNNNRSSLELLNEIRDCVLRQFKGFYLVYQPLIASNTDKCVGMEALLRWRDNKGVTVAPNYFIPVLERDPVFYELGNWILRKAMEDALPYVKENPDFVLNVNIAYTQIEKSEFLSAVMRIIDEIGFPTKNLCIELTERCRQLNEELLRNTVVYLQAQGIQIAMDDFGTGFSSIDILKTVRVDEIKLDYSFVHDVLTNEVNRSIVESLSKLATDIGALVCMEGVEDEETKEFLKRFPADRFQGYLFAKPMEIEQFKSWYENFNQ